MATLGAMKTRIADELDRQNLSSQIANAISDAIAEYEQDRFWFNESRDNTFSTVVSQRIYTASDAAWIASLIEVDDLFLTYAGQNRRLRRISPEESELFADNSAAVGAPYWWAYYNQSIYLYPFPDGVYPVRALAHIRLPALTDDSQSNAWTTEAERLIRRRAKALLFAEVISKPEEAVSNGVLANEELDRLKSESSKRRATGVIKSTCF